jgi:hypothetical protein
MGKTAHQPNHSIVPLEIRDLIDAVVHSVILDTYQHFPHGLESRCAIYAIVGAQCLSRLTGAVYRPMCGGQWIPLANGSTFFLTPSVAEIQAANALHHLRNYHCWIQANHGDSVEVVDFTLRHNDSACELLGIAPLQSSPEPYTWIRMPASKFGGAHMSEVCYYASCLRVDRKLSELLGALETENRRAFDHLVRRCLLQIHEKLVELETLWRQLTPLGDKTGRLVAAG